MNSEQRLEKSCNPHPDAPHGFDRQASHSAGQYVCECEGWETPLNDKEILELAIKYAYQFTLDDKQISFTADALLSFTQDLRAKDAERIAELEDWFKKDNSCYCNVCSACAESAQKLLANKSDWLAKHDAEVREKVLKEVVRDGGIVRNITTWRKG